MGCGAGVSGTMDIKGSGSGVVGITNAGEAVLRPGVGGGRGNAGCGEGWVGCDCVRVGEEAGVSRGGWRSSHHDVD